ncbi:MAG: NAD-dependent epimerase/dehydratase family protein [Candidatus Liptonbacteria bacterium]|nr:NAD-dependent epimerase/dehydratase family protein [Candidatus Liptonbacteria bacterium]
MREKVLITGGAGFIGSHTADALSKHGYRIRILDNLQPPVHSGKWPAYVLNKGFELVRGDVRKKADFLKALRGVSYVYHLAAYQDQRPDFSKFFETNTVGTALLYELIVEKKLPIKKVILASSQFAYGDGKYQCVHNAHPSPMLRRTRKFFYPEPRTERQFKSKKFDILCSHGRIAKFFPFREEQPLVPTNSYGLSKEALERLAFRLGKTYGIPTTALRYSVVQGPRQSPKNLYSGALRIFTVQALSGKPITVYEDGLQTRDFVNVNDVVSANILALKNPRTNFSAFGGEVFNVGGGKAYRVLDFAKLVKKITGSSSPILIGGFRRTDTRHAVSDIGKLKKLGWRPRFAPEKSVRDYVEWYQENF